MKEECPMKGRMSQCADGICRHNSYIVDDILQKYKKTDMTTEEIKQQAREIIVSDDTNTLYIRTKKYPEGELIIYKEVDDFIDSLIDKTVQMTEERIVGELKKTKIVLNPVNVRGKIAIKPSDDYRNGYSNALKDIISLITNKSDINK